MDCSWMKGGKKSAHSVLLVKGTGWTGGRESGSGVSLAKELTLHSYTLLTSLLFQDPEQKEKKELCSTPSAPEEEL